MNKEKDVFLQLAKVSCMQHIRLIHLEETSSTNDYLCHYKGEEGTLLTGHHRLSVVGTRTGQQQLGE